MSQNLIEENQSRLQILSMNDDKNYEDASDTELYNEEVALNLEVAQLEQILKNSLQSSSPSKKVRDSLSYPSDVIESGQTSRTGFSRQGTDKHMGHFSQTQTIRSGQKGGSN